MPRPQAKANLIHQLILTALVANKRGLANNVSERSIDAMARRWMR